MDPLTPPKTLTVYALVRQSGMMFLTAGSIVGSPNIGAGFFSSLKEAEHNRTLEVLKEQTGNTQIHVFELSVPNPAYKE